MREWTKEELEKLKTAGKISAQARNYAVSLVKEGALIEDIADKVEEKMRELGAQPAFPCCISINEIAAHYAPLKGDKITIKETDYVKLDLGAHVDGFIGDTAITVRLAGKDALIECSEKMLQTAISIATPGTLISEIGEAIESVANEFNLKSITNLCGHSVERYTLHAGLTIPNVKNNIRRALEEGEVFAIEPFATAGNIIVKDSEPTTIFRWITDSPTRMQEARHIQNMAKMNFFRLPFAKRWIQNEVQRYEIALRQLQEQQSLYGYKTLKEPTGHPVSQTEHTILIQNKPLILTK